MAVARDVPRAPEVPLEVGLERLVPGAHVDVEHGPEVGVRAGVVDEDVDLAEALDRLRDQARALVLLAGVGGDAEDAVGAVLLGDRLGHGGDPFGLARREDDAGAVGGESARDGLADAAASARDEADLALEGDARRHVWDN